MFRSILLYDAFELVALPREWTEFTTMVTPYNSDLQMFDEEGWPVVSMAELRLYEALWARFACRLERKLWAGEWIAEGLNPALGPRFVEIDVRMWEFLHIVPMTEEADGDDIHFTHLRFTSKEPAPLLKPRATPAEKRALRSQLITWMKGQPDQHRWPMLKVDFFAAARNAFSGTQISDTMLLECRRAANLPSGFIQLGRPKKELSEL